MWIGIPAVRDAHVWKKTYKETYIYEKRPTKKAFTYKKSALVPADHTPTDVTKNTSVLLQHYQTHLF